MLICLAEAKVYIQESIFAHIVFFQNQPKLLVADKGQLVATLGALHCEL
jgi:hypothetical protein